MEQDNILDYDDVMDGLQRLRRRINPKDGSGWVPNGLYIVPRKEGAPFFEISYRDGVLHGRYIFFWENGKIGTEGQHNEGMQDGTWHDYNEDGTINAIIEFKNDKVIDDAQYCYDSHGNLIDIVRSSEFKMPGGDSPAKQ